MVFFRRYVICESDVNPYEEDDYGYMPEAFLYANESGDIYFLDDSGECLVEFASSKYIRNKEIFRKLHPATRKEIKAAGLWDYVENKEDYSSKRDQIEVEMDEYLRIGEEVSKTQNSEEKSLEDDKD